MEKRLLAVLLGDSVLIDGAAARLEENTSIRIIHLNAPSVDVYVQLKHLAPDLVVFELDSPYAPPIASLLCELPGTTLMGLDLTRSRAIVVSSTQHTTHNMEELGHLIQAQASSDARARTGGPRETSACPAEILLGTNCTVIHAPGTRRASSYLDKD